jgi:D-glycero-alpha-D-manno-heptose 1-phosphate guanylyltransferase
MIENNFEFDDSLKAPFRGLGGIKECIILAGGLGTRLRDAVPDLPKCMAPVAGRPFLFYVINYLRSQGIEKFIFSLGYKHELIEEYLQSKFSTLTYQTVIESEPLGTGGAIQLAVSKATEKNIAIANGDTLFKVNLTDAGNFHFNKNADCTLLLKPMQNFDRYGVVETTADHSVKNFKEKQFYTEGTINGGLYILNVDKFLQEAFPEKFSFEKDYLENSLSLAKDNERRIYAQVQNEYFIDIGIPEDYNRVQNELAPPPLNLATIDKTWTLFLDRDGVINEDKVGSYIFNPREFHFMQGAPEFFHKLTATFGHIIVVTNQRGVGRGLMTEDDLTAIHTKMTTAIQAAGGRIDGVYFAPAIINNDPFRKPNPGMAFRAKADFPAIDLSKSIMVGNKHSDMLFGKNAGMYTLFVATTNPEVPFPHPDIDLRYDLLEDFVKAL